MLPASHRLAKDREIKQVLVKGRSFFSPLFRLRVLPSGKPVSRFAIVVSAKVSKKATVRNTIRRRLSESLRHHLDTIKPGYDVMVAVSNRALGSDYHQLEDQLLSDLKKAKLLP